eukprot:2019371-Amphidinium_carterae.1
MERQRSADADMVPRLAHVIRLMQTGAWVIAHNMALSIVQCVASYCVIGCTVRPWQQWTTALAEAG